MTSTSIQDLLQLSHDLGREDRGLAILGEGNTSMRLDEKTFAVKASGSSLGTLTEEGVARCHSQKILDLFEHPELCDDEIDRALLDARVYSTSRKPSTEALFHAYLLTLPDIEFVGHTHPHHVNAVLCSPRASELANQRMFPDQVVCCGPSSALVPYTTPGVPLARAIREAVEAFRARFGGEVPRTILLENHGLIALGKSAAGVLATTLMMEKSARIFVGAAALGGPRFMTDEQIAYIAGWKAESHRQKMLNL